MSRNEDSVDRILGQWSRERPDLDVSGMGIVLRTLLVAGTLSERLKETLAPHDLAPWEFDVLSALRRSPQPLSATELCESAQLTSGGMTHRLDRLEESKWVKRRPSPDDRRSIEVSLTARGRALVDHVVGDRMADALRSVECLDRADRKELVRILRLWNAHFES